MCNIKKVWVLIISILACNAYAMQQDEFTPVNCKELMEQFAGYLIAFKPVSYIDEFVAYKFQPNSSLRYGIVSSQMSPEFGMPYYSLTTKLETCHFLSLLMRKVQSNYFEYEPSLPSRALLFQAMMIRKATVKEKELIRKAILNNGARLGTAKTDGDSIKLLESSK